MEHCAAAAVDRRLCPQCNGSINDQVRRKREIDEGVGSETAKGRHKIVQVFHKKRRGKRTIVEK